MTNAPPALLLENLSYQYPYDILAPRRRGIKHIGLSVCQGEAFGYLGTNGAGKTTTIKCILGLVTPRTGRATIFGVDARDPLARAKVGFIPEQPYFYDNLSILETLRLYGSLYGLSKREAAIQISKWAERLGIGERLGERMRALSKGLMQRVALVQALMPSPRLLILDEPFSGLDPIGRREFRDIFDEEKRQGTTLFLCSHILSDVEYLCDRVSILVDGELKGIHDVSQLSASMDGAYTVRIRGVLQETPSLPAHQVTTLENSTVLTFASRADAQRGLLEIANRHEVLGFERKERPLEELFNTLCRE